MTNTKNWKNVLDWQRARIAIINHKRKPNQKALARFQIQLAESQKEVVATEEKDIDVQELFAIKTLRKKALQIFTKDEDALVK